MKRDMELIRKILLGMEEFSDPNNYPEIKIEGYDEALVHFHTKLLYEAGLIDAIDASDSGGLCYLPKYITWDGYEFLEAVRDEGRWQKIKDTILKKGGAMVFDVIKAVAVDAVKNAVLS